MKYMTVWSFAPENYKATMKRFKEGAEPLEGVRRLGRWAEFGTMKGFDLLETDDPVAITKLGHYWADLADMKTVPVVGDEVVAKAHGKSMKYMTVWSFPPENYKAAMKRIEEGAEPLEGVRRLGRWAEFGTMKGFDLLETDDPVAITKLGHYWADLADMKTVPVVDDEVVAKAHGM